MAIKIIPLYDENNVRYDGNYVINKIMSEVSALIRFEHDNIIKYYDHFANNDFLCIVTEYCEV
jgi:serine/threonine protein kinase